jgi:hypothetical protein
LWLLNPSTFVEYFLLIKVIVLWDFQSKEIVAKAFDMIVVENNVTLIVDIVDYPQKLNEIVETWHACIWYQDVVLD